MPDRRRLQHTLHLGSGGSCSDCLPPAAYPADPRAVRGSGGGPSDCAERVRRVLRLRPVAQPLVRFACGSERARHMSGDARWPEVLFACAAVVLMRTAGDVLSHPFFRRCEKNWLSSRALARVTDVRRQLQAHLRRCGVPLKSAGRDPVPVLRALAAGFFSHAATLAPFGCAAAAAGGDEARPPYTLAVVSLVAFCGGA